MIVVDINGTRLKTKDIVMFFYTDFTGSVLHIKTTEVIIYKIDKVGRVKMKGANKLKYSTRDSSQDIILIERRNREVLFEKHSKIITI